MVKARLRKSLATPPKPGGTSCSLKAAGTSPGRAQAARRVPGEGSSPRCVGCFYLKRGVGPACKANTGAVCPHLAYAAVIPSPNAGMGQPHTRKGSPPMPAAHSPPGQPSPPGEARVPADTMRGAAPPPPR
ncbi:hypothetical protein NL676_034964 [Syzygium grande]|nr:hypothetical protein NL676_034964 [Syzygium grande]